MVREGDLDGDGALNQTEFCVLMVRLIPQMMEDAETWLEEAISQELCNIQSLFSALMTKNLFLVFF
ncbi:unnamed protein product [Eruca vesicaria subsp. sativa]|uniref:EF-hand domain-containing protein n=1 Tax=Eruca vesicaria subsp. sativa TaxID=29727 RepID=A0ABC8LTY8_ERUVS|nr:unnamed protein product [Eruca vesicaria subsp. sativa]